MGRDGGGKPRDVLGVNPDLLWALGGSYEERREVGLFPAPVRVLLLLSPDSSLGEILNYLRLSKCLPIFLWHAMHYYSFIFD